MSRRVGWFLGSLAAILAIVALAIAFNDQEADPTSADALANSTPTTLGGEAASTSTLRPNQQDDSAATPATSPPGVTTTTTTTLPTNADPNVGSAPNNSVPFQTSIELEGWQIGISAADTDATELILEYVDFNDPPADGNQYVIIELTGRRVAASAAEPVFDWRLVGDAFEHQPNGLECGVVPDSIYDVGETSQGNQFTANVCFEVPSEQVGANLLLSLGLFDEDGQERFFALG